MYTHLLVPLDGTELSMGNVTAAVRLAEALGARVTFCHVLPSYEGLRAAYRAHRMEGSQLIAVAHDAEEKARAYAESLLAKAAAYAQARGVAHASVNLPADRPVDAIVRAAHEHRCDLIVMASHAVTGARALLRSSLTAKVLREADVAVLVTRVEATDPHAQASRACALIQDEHRSLAAIVQGMERLLADARSGSGEGFDRVGFDLMLRYVTEFPEQLHHPKEEQTLHRLLRQRTDRAAAMLEALESQHHREYELVAALQSAVSACPQGARGDDAPLVALGAAFDAFAEHVWDHLKTEERLLLPMAIEVLDPKDWKEIARVFEGNQDPGYGGWTQEEFRRHFTTLAARLATTGAESGRSAG